MNGYRLFASSLTVFCLVLLSQPSPSAQPLRERNELLFEQLRRVHGLSDQQMDSIRAILIL